MSNELLVPEEIYRTSQVQIGTKVKNANMEEFISGVTKEGLNIIDINKIDERIRIAAKFLSKYDPSGIVIVASREYAKKPATKMAELLSAKAITERFIPGTFTNPNISGYVEPDVVLINDPAVDSQAMMEAVKNGIPIVAILHTNNSSSYVDLIIPGNNKGRESLALIYYLLTREILKLWGKDTAGFKKEDFQAEL